MCTLILAHQVYEDAPLFLASNRDEQLDRPSAPPQVWTQHGTRFVAPRDEREGGTWLGVNEWGVVVAITNRFGDPRDPSRRSRGRVVIEALQERYAAVAADGIHALNPELFNPFHLLIADRDLAQVVWSDGESMHRESLDPGFHVLTERSYLAAGNGRGDRLTAAIDELANTGAATPRAVADLLRHGDVGDIDGACVHIPELGYGTRSSTLIELGARAVLQFSDGAPCQAEYEDYSALLRDVVRGR